jgi:hypothetical protein
LAPSAELGHVGRCDPLAGFETVGNFNLVLERLADRDDAFLDAIAVDDKTRLVPAVV